VHGPLTGEPGDVYSLIDRVSPSVALISVSDHQRTPLPHINWLATCHNAIAMDAYPFKDADDGYLLFLGRMSPDKGAHNAVRVAAEMGLPMILAGKMHDVAERGRAGKRRRAREGAIAANELPPVARPVPLTSV